MHVLDRFAINCGASRSTPTVEEAFFPVPFDSYITLNKFCPHPSQTYDYWPDVIEDVVPLLQKAGVAIIEVGDKPEGQPPLRNTYDLRGKLNIKQMSYIIKKSRYHLTGDSFCADLANILKTKTCQVFGATPPYLFAPQWNKELTTILSGSTDEAPPTFATPTTIKTVNKIYPEALCEALLDELSIPHCFKSLQTKFIGDKYHLPAIDIVPDFLPTPGFLAHNTLHLRLDYKFDPNSIPHWCQDNRKIVIISDQEVDINLLTSFKGTIIQIGYEVNSSTSLDYLTALKNTGIPLHVFSRTDNEKELADLRLYFIDWTIEHRKTLSKKCLDSALDIDYNTAFYKSSKAVLSKGQEFPCKQAWLLNIPKDPTKAQPIIDQDEFWKEQAHFRIIQHPK
mgnify:CR=1 FL=1